MDFLAANVEALWLGNRELAERLSWPVDDRHVTRDAAGELCYQVHQTRHRLEPRPDALAAAIAAAPPADALFVFGVGGGDLVAALLAARPGATIVAWDRDPWLLRLALQRHDWAQAIGARRLRLCLGSDLVALAADDAAALGARAIVHPLLGTVYRQERRLLEAETARRPLVALAAGGLFVDDLANALRDEGHAVFTLDLQRLAREELDRSIRVLRPTFMAAINYTDGLAEFAAGHGCPLLIWEVDPATSALPPCRAPTDGAHVFTYRRANVSEFRAAGFQHVAYLPLGADARKRAPVAMSAAERARYSAPVSFVGSSLVPQMEGFQRAFMETFAAALAEAPSAVVDAESVMRDVLAEQRRDLSRYRVPALLAARLPELAAVAPRRLEELARLLAEIAAGHKRAAAVARLARQGIAVWGDEGWRAVAGGSAGVDYRGPAGHAVELTKIYNASLVNLDVGRLYQSDIVTMRVFDVLACGGFVLAEHSDALAELFEVGSEIDSYRTLEEMESKVAHYLAHPEAAWAIAARGRQAVLARHTIAARARTMLASVRR